MRKTAVLAIFRKELRGLLKDRKTILLMFGLPLVLYPVMIMLISSILMNMSASEEAAVSRLAVCGSDPQVMEYLIDEEEFSLAGTGVPDRAAAETALNAGEADVVLVCEEGNYTVVSLDSRPASRTAAERLVSRLEAYRSRATEEILSQQGLDPAAVMEPFAILTEDVSSKEQTLGSVLGGVIPLLIIIGVFLGTMQPAMDVTAGEKERCTQETLMTFPVTGKEMIAGKFLLVSLCGLVSALLYLVTVTILGLYIIGMVGSLGGEAVRPDLSGFLPAVGVTLLAVMAFSLFLGALFMCVCSFAKSTKEASSYISPLLFVVMMTAYAGMLNVTLNTGLSVVPVLNIVLLIKSVFTFEYDLFAILLVLISNMAYASIAIAVLGKLYTSERVLFGEGGPSLLERPAERKKGTMPAPGDGVIVLLVSLVFFLYLGGMLQLKLGLTGAGLSQLLLLAVPVFAAWFGRLDFRAVFSLKRPRLSQIPAAVLLGIGSLIFFNMLTDLILTAKPESVQVYSDAMNALTEGRSLFEKLLMVALAPAICEEALFRGYLTASVKRLKPVWAMLITALVFGLYHMNLMQGIYAFCLGCVLFLAVQKTGSIFCGSIIHFTANALSVLLTELMQSTEAGTVTGPMAALGEWIVQAPLLPSMAVGLVLLLAGGFWMYKSVTS